MNEQVQEFLKQATQSIQSGQPAQALDLANQALLLDPSNAEAFLLKGISMAQTGQSDLATEAFLSAIQLEPYNAKARYNLSVHYYGQGNKKEALNESLAALNAEPGHSAAREMVQRVENELGMSSTGIPDPVIPNVPPATASGGIAPLGHSTGVQPPPNAGPTGNPYAQNPYGTDQQQQPAPYYRSPYEQLPGGGTSVHSVAFVEQMGDKWTTMGWIVGAVGLGMSIISIIVNMSAMSSIMTNPERYTGSQFDSPVSTLLSLLGFALALGSIIWTAIDISDQRGNWGWFVGQLFCCCCGLPYVIQLIYMAAGRNK